MDDDLPSHSIFHGIKRPAPARVELPPGLRDLEALRDDTQMERQLSELVDNPRAVQWLQKTAATPEGAKRIADAARGDVLTTLVYSSLAAARGGGAQKRPVSVQERFSAIKPWI